MRGRFSGHIRSNVVAYIALFVALGGTAWAGATIGSQDVIDESLRSEDLMNNAAVRSPDVRNDTEPGGGLGALDLAPGSVGSSEVINGSIGGADVNEASLGQMPEAAIGGTGRWNTTGGECDPESKSFVTCTFVTLNLPRQTRVLVNGRIRASTEIDSDLGLGDCVLATSQGVIGGTDTRVVVEDSNIEHIPLTAVSALVGPGPVDFGVECNQLESFGAIRYSDMAVSAVALSPN